MARHRPADSLMPAGPGRQVSITVLIRDAFMTFEEFHPVDLRAT
jgi:hypothetical protein